MNEERILDDIIRREGDKYTNRKSDRGGPTKYGITLATLRDVRGPHITAEDVKNLTEPEAREIYRELYIKRPGFDRILDPRLRAFIIDFGVNSGPTRAAMALQRMIGTPADGIIGPDTIARLAGHAEAGNNVYAGMLRARLRLYVDIVMGDPAIKRFRISHGDTQIENLRGWMNRLGEFF